ncbi:MAG: DNA translocase FtsK [Rhabdochlamydiaceae bacterium]|nr:DNA translocase FtsK [Rhabdochlamydiaceae bacterium]
MTKNSQAQKKCAHPEVKGLFLLAVALFLTLSWISFDGHIPANNWMGLIGYWLSFGLTYLFGLSSFCVIGFLFWAGWQLLSKEEIPSCTAKILYFSLCLFSANLLLNLVSELGCPFPTFLQNKVYSESIFFEQPYPHRYTRHNMGGAPIYFLYKDLPTFNLQRMLSDVGIAITFSITFLSSFLLLTQIKLVPLVRKFFKACGSIPWKALFSRPLTKEPEESLPSLIASLQLTPPSSIKPLYPTQNFSREPIQEEPEPEPERERKPIQERAPKAPVSKKEQAIQAQRVYNGNYQGYTIPPPSLLTSPKKVDHPSLKKELKKQADILEETLMSFGIEAKVGEIYCGPTITSFEVHPAIGVKVQKITAVENDIALNLQAKSMRIIAPIPGKAAVGVEIPSPFPQEVSFKEMLTVYQTQPKKMHIPVLLGKTVSGEHLVSDLAKMPHCIIAGATGSGKSVCINTIVLSIVMNARPDEVKLLLVDPKKVELTGYTHLPHLIAPVITEPHGAYAALNWLVKEMTLRYEMLRQLGVRNIHAFNSRTINKELEASLSIQVPERMFAIVAIIDEFADLMMVSSADLETPIARIAQMARAVGIHLILATQRPSREVITGLIKANFPTRISFKVASRVNSQIILDDNGADSLLGNGDMLFLPPGSSQLIRAQGAYISDDDINEVISFISKQAPANYLIKSFDEMKKEELFPESKEDGAPKDSLYEQALSIVLDTQNASTTFLQRKLKIGYARAASLIDELELNGVISSQDGSKPRRILTAKKEKVAHEDAFSDEPL